MARKPSDSELPRWGIFELRKRGQRLGSVRARDPAHAIEVAIKEMEITDPLRRARLSAQREE